MATKQNSVDLVISAKNESEKAFKELTDQLKQIESVLDQTGESKLFNNVSEQMDDLAKKMAMIEQALDDASLAKNSVKAANEFTEALKRQNDAIERAETRLAKLKQQYVELEQSAVGKAQAQITKTLSEQTQVQQTLEKAIADTRLEIEKSNAALEKNAGLDEKAVARIDRQKAKVLESGKAWEETTGQIKAAQVVLAEISARRDPLKLVQGETAARLTALKRQLDEARKLASEQTKAARVDGATDEAKLAAQNAKAQVKALREMVAEQSAAAKSLAEQLKPINKEYADQARTIDKLIAKSEKQKTSYDDLTKSVAKFTEEARKEGAERQQASIERLNKSLESLQTRYTQTTAKVQAAQAALSKAVQPDAGANQKLGELKAKIDGATKSVEEERAALVLLNDELKKAGLSTDTVSARQKELAAVTERLKKQQRDLRIEMKQTERAAVDSSKGVTQFRSALDFFGGDKGRTTLSLLQRIRGEFLAIAATYGGLYAIGGAVRGIYDASVLLNKAQARFSTLFGGDEKKVADEIKFVREEADRLGINFETALEQYSKFAAGIKEGSVPLDELRGIFTGFSTAARVGGLSAEELQRIFTALTQIFSKNKLSLEELQGQLADAMPGAVRRTAEALGIAEDKLRKMIEGGKLNAKSMILLANNLQKEFGANLSKALESPAAAFERYNNAVTELQLAIAESGFIDELVKGLRELTAIIKDPAFKQDAVAFAGAIASIGKAVVWVVQHFEELKIAIGAFVGVKLIQFFGGLGVKIVEVGKHLQTWGVALAQAGSKFAGFVSFVGTWLARLPGLAAAAFGGWQIGTWLFENSSDIQKFMVFFIAQIEEMKIDAVAVWDKMVATWDTGFVEMLDSLYRQWIKWLRSLAQSAIDLAPEGAIKESLKAILNIKVPDPGETDLEKRIRSIGEAAEKAKEQVRTSYLDMTQAIDAEFAKKAEDAAPKPKPGSVVVPRGKANGFLTKDRENQLIGEAEITTEDTGVDQVAADLRQKITDALAAIDREIQEKSADTLDQRIAAIRGEYDKLRRDIEQAGGMSKFPGAAESLDQIVAIKQVQEVEKEINDLIDRRRETISNINEQQELGVLTVEEATKRVNETNAELLPQMTVALDTARKIAATINGTPINASVEAQSNLVELEQERASKEQLFRLEQQINDAMSIRAQRIQTVEALVETGSKTELEARQKIAEINDQTNDQIAVTIEQLRQMILLDEQFANSVSGQKMLANLDQIQGELKEVNKALISADQVNQAFASNATNALDQFASGALSAKEAFRQFASDFLRQIALMITQMAIFNAIKASGFGSMISGATVPTNHTGGIVGLSGSRTRVSPLAFANAVRYHSGGVAGLKPNEVPTVLERGEEVLTRDDPRHQMNGGGAQAPVQLKIVNTIDSSSVLNEALNSAAGQKTLVNAIRANKASIKSVLT